jgi:hypothetical protein
MVTIDIDAQPGKPKSVEPPPEGSLILDSRLGQVASATSHSIVGSFQSWDEIGRESETSPFL